MTATGTGLIEQLVAQAADEGFRAYDERRIGTLPWLVDVRSTSIINNWVWMFRCTASKRKAERLGGDCWIASGDCRVVPCRAHDVAYSAVAISDRRGVGRVLAWPCASSRIRWLGLLPSDRVSPKKTPGQRVTLVSTVAAIRKFPNSPPSDLLEWSVASQSVHGLRNGGGNCSGHGQLVTDHLAKNSERWSRKRTAGLCDRR